MTLLADARTLQDDLAALRRELHQVPEVGLDLPRTQEIVLRALEGLPLEITTGTATTSVVAVLRGTGSRPWRRSVVQTAVADTCTSSRRSSPLIRW